MIIRLLKKKMEPLIEEYREGVLMLRYDEGIYVSGSDLLCCN